MKQPLQDGAWYRLPDGTRCQARESKDPNVPMWALISADGTTPLYGWPSEMGPLALFRLEYAGDAGYRIVPCDLTLSDLTLEPQP